MSVIRRRGFTLLEVMLAVALSGMVALVAHQLFAAAVDGSRRLREARRELDRRSNAHMFLRSTFMSVEVGIDSAESFLGYRDRMRFSSWVPTSNGWRERKTIELRLDGDRWVAVTDPGYEIDLARGVRELRFDYLLEPGEASHWVEEWESAVSAPLAVRVRVTHQGHGADTMLYLIKARG